ncbi:NHL repeat-containing protein, partial [Endothiovibrio diazotrophicus]
MDHPEEMAFGPDGRLYIADRLHHQVLVLEPRLGGTNLGDFSIASEDGLEYYEFSSDGRHQRTLDAVTGAALLLYTYDEDRHLTTVTDANGNQTTIERDATGHPTAIIAPDGQRTRLAVDANGYLSEVEDPTGALHQFQYDENGLLLATTTPRDNTNHYAYDDLGRLLEDRDPAGGGWQLGREESDDGYVSIMTSGEGRNYRFAVEKLADGGSRLVNTSPAGLKTRKEFPADGTERIQSPDGTIEQVVLTPDPRFGMSAPVEGARTRLLPSGLLVEESTERTADLSNPGDPLSFTELTETHTTNGRV